ncbi:MAG: LysM peptidoglycan-binding domain-containing protein [Planctomycetes bacterium]|nr:LysM peptidoglycan-binding domain-containing protein [Planctomycetota bacterium]
MQLQKDVLIAGGVVVVCVALVVVALVATGKKDQPSDSGSSTAMTDSYSSSSSSPGYDSSYSSLGSGPSSSSSGALPPSDSFGALPPAPSAGTSLDSGFGASSSAGASPFGPSSSASSSALDSGFGASSSFGPPTGPSSFGPTSSDPLGASPVTAPLDATPAAATTTQGGGTHTVAKGETLGDISATHYGTTKHWRKIVEANPGLDPARLKIGQVIQIPAVESAAAAPAAAGGANTHTVAKGESYYTIAKKELGSASRWREIERLNGIPAESLKVGTVLKIPAKEQGGAGTSAGTTGTGGGKTHVVSKGETLGDISKEYFGTTTKWKQIVEANPGLRPENLKVGQSIAIPDLPASTGGAAGAAPAVGGNAYTVKAGDTLESIAAATLGKKSAWKQIVEANPGLKPTALRVGQTIQIPGGSIAAPLAPAPAGGLDAGFGPSPAPGAAPGAAPVAPAPQPTFQDDPFYSPYDVQPAAPAAAGSAGRI